MTIWNYKKTAQFGKLTFYPHCNQVLFFRQQLHVML